jgi:hypothetical protein
MPQNTKADTEKYLFDFVVELRDTLVGVFPLIEYLSQCAGCDSCPVNSICRKKTLIPTLKEGVEDLRDKVNELDEYVKNRGS